MLSIIVPVYNVEPYLTRCLNSIVQQDYNDIEIIIVNDGSTDNSSKIIQKFGRMDSRIVIIDKNNGGLSSARNAGLEISKGEYITFVDSDDYISENAFKSNIEVLVSNPDIDILSYSVVKKSDNSTLLIGTNKSYLINGKRNILAEYIIGNKITNSVCNKIFKRAVFDKLRFDVGRTNEDTLLIPQIIERSNKMFISNIGRYYYIAREGSIIKSNINIGKIIDHFEGQFQLYTLCCFYKLNGTDLLLSFHRIFIENYFMIREHNSELFFSEKCNKHKLDLNTVLKSTRFRNKNRIKLLIYSVFGIKIYNLLRRKIHIL